MNIYAMIGIMIGLLLLGAAGGYYFCKSGIPAQLTNQQMVDKKECESAQQITKDANDALQKNRDDIARKLASLKLQQPSACVRVASGADLPGGGPEHAGRNGAGLSGDFLNGYAAQAEIYRSSLIICAGVLAKERQQNQPAQ